MDMPGLRGLYETFGAWVKTGKAGNGHEKSWYYWLQLFGRYEWPCCVGLLAALFFGLVLFARATNHWQTHVPPALYQQLIPTADQASHPGIE